ncbi:hypothetical protein [Dactylosporangium sp. CA-233914]|uniref:hypothetical protein n=1 Tax=Dactylosporangium sp. CA-233914 TaxID=3239934 RepID=UPI003D90720C
MIMLASSAFMLVKRDARAGRPVPRRPEPIGKMLDDARPGIEARRDADIAKATRMDSHMRPGRRARAVDAQAGESASVVASSARNDRIDAEFATHCARPARTLKST